MRKNHETMESSIVTYRIYDSVTILAFVFIISNWDSQSRVDCSCLIVCVRVFFHIFRLRLFLSKILSVENQDQKRKEMYAKWTTITTTDSQNEYCFIGRKKRKKKKPTIIQHDQKKKTVIKIDVLLSFIVSWYVSYGARELCSGHLNTISHTFVQSLE